MTQLNAINEVVDFIRCRIDCDVSLDRRLDQAIKALEARAEVLRSRAKRNRANRGRKR